MRKGLIAVVALMVGIVASAGAFAGALTPDEQQFFDKHLSDIVKVEPTRLNGAALDHVFKVPFYDIKVTIQQGDGTETTHVIAARDGSKLVQMSSPGTDEPLPQFKALLNPRFKLKTEQDAKEMEQAIDAINPISHFGSDTKAKAIKHQGNEWLFIRGEFFKKHSGYVVTTDADGTITDVKYSLKLP